MSTDNSSVFWSSGVLQSAIWQMRTTILQKNTAMIS